MHIVHSGARAHYNPTFRFTREQLIEMATLQAEANDVMSDAWRTSTNSEIPYYRAALVEAVEAVSHIGFKWWKKSTPNLEQAQMELIDILHFAISDHLRDAESSPELFAEDAIDLMRPVQGSAGAVILQAVGALPSRGTYPAFEAIHYTAAGEIDIRSFHFNDLADQFILQTIAAGQVSWELMICLFENLGMTANQAHAMYVGKNVLNKFRTANGQRDDMYFKIWDGIEDNVYLTNYIQERLSVGNPVTADALYSYLTVRYDSCADRRKS